jgi:hypothetical protein
MVPQRGNNLCGDLAGGDAWCAGTPYFVVCPHTLAEKLALDGARTHDGEFDTTPT